MKKYEESWVITGGRVGGLWVGWRRWPNSGEPHRVTVPVNLVLNRAQWKRDVIGFMHTHPNMSATPSQTDVETMRAWCFTLGRPLLCLIEGNEGLLGWVFCNEDCKGIQVMKVWSLAWGIVLGVEHGRRA